MAGAIFTSAFASMRWALRSTVWSLHGGLRPFGATFFIFSDYMRPSVRLAALMEIRPIYVWTHDSIGLGEDGPTHQPIEQLASLRAMPNMTIMRPADANETAICWRFAMEDEGGPVGLALTRQKIPIFDAEATTGARNGGYILVRESRANPDLILIGTGSEVSLLRGGGKTFGTARRRHPRRQLAMLGASSSVKRKNIGMKCCHQLLPRACRLKRPRRLGGNTTSASGAWPSASTTLAPRRPAEVIFREFGFTPERVAERALGLLGKNRGASKLRPLPHKGVVDG